MINSHNFIENTYWDKVFYHLSISDILEKYDYVWIIEDDCYLNKRLFGNFINKYDKISQDLILFGWFKEYEKYKHKWYSRENKKLNGQSFFKKENLRAAATQFCRLSPK